MLERAHQSGSRDRNYNYSAALFAEGAVEIVQMMRLLGGRPETPIGLAGVGDMSVTSKGGPNVRAGRLEGTGLPFSQFRIHLRGVRLAGEAHSVDVDGPLPYLTLRG